MRLRGFGLAKSFLCLALLMKCTVVFCSGYSSLFDWKMKLFPPGHEVFNFILLTWHFMDTNNHVKIWEEWLFTWVYETNPWTANITKFLQPSVKTVLMKPPHLKGVPHTLVSLESNEWLFAIAFPSEHPNCVTCWLCFYPSQYIQSQVYFTFVLFWQVMMILIKKTYKRLKLC